MDIKLLTRKSEFTWQIEPHGAMRVPGIIYASEEIIHDMALKVSEQLSNVTTLPGIVKACYAMPDAHWGYGFPIGGVAAFDPEEGGVVSAGGVGFDISCGVRTLHTGLTRKQLEEIKQPLAEALYHAIPAGVGSTGRIHLNLKQMDAMLTGGALWAVEHGYGTGADLERIEEQGCMEGALPSEVSPRAKKRQQDEMGTLGSGNHYLEVQHVVKVYDNQVASGGGATRSAPSFSKRWSFPQAVTESCCRTVSSRVLPLNRRLAAPTWGRCERESIVPWPTGRSSPISPGKPLPG